jgi:hypothetical protein
VALPLLAAAGLAYGGLSRVAPRTRTFVTLGCAAELLQPRPAPGGGGRTVASVSGAPYRAIPADAAIIAAAAAAQAATRR